MGSIVSLVRVRSSEVDIKDSICKAINLVDFKTHSQVRLAVIKPNLCYYWDADTGYTTDPRIVAGIIDWVRETYGANVDIKVVESDATAMQTKLAFLMLGYERLAKEKNVELFNLSNDTAVSKKIYVNGHEIKFKVPQLLLEADLFINAPKLKIMRDTRITCAMKNVFGCISYPRKNIYHPILKEAIVGINKVLHPHLNVVDGIVALGRFPIKLGLIMAGVDPFSIDWVASKIMGYNPSKVEFLRIAMKEKLGSIEGMDICGQNLEEFRKVFPKEGIIPTKYLWAIQLGLLKMYFKLVKDIMPPALQE